MSGEPYTIYRERALEMLEEAERLLREGKGDLAALLSEYAAQLYVKALIIRLEGEEVRGHGIRSLLGFLASTLEDLGYREQATRIMDFARRNRRLMAELEEAHVRSVYGPFRYSLEQAGVLLSAAKRVIGLLREVESVVGEEARGTQA